MSVDWRTTQPRLLLHFVVAVAGILLMATSGYAGILDASWTAPTTNVDGTPLTDLASYRVYYGTTATPCPGATFASVASATASPSAGQTVSYRLTGLTRGTTYFVSVTAVDTAGNESACLTPAQTAAPRAEFSVSPSGTLAFGNVALGAFGEQTITIQNTVGGTISGTVTTSAPFSIISGATFTLTGSASQAVTVRFTPTQAAAVSTNLTITVTGSTETRLLTGTGLADSIAPTAAITTPTATGTFSTTSSTVNLGGTAVDNIGVTQVTWANNRGGSGTATGTTTWTANGIALQTGANVLTITARDAANNTGTATLTVTVTDATAPTVAITGPTAAATFSTTSTTLNLAGTAADNIAVTQVTWTNDRGGSGTATGTATWTANGVALQAGVNVLTVTARDAANNTGTATLTVTVTPPDTTAPTAAITGPTAAATFATTTATVNLAGTASDNIAVTQVTWANSRGGSGTATGTSSWTANGVALQPGANVFTVTARDAASNTGTATLTVTFTDTTAPTVAITGPTAAATFNTNSTSVNLAGTASDNVAVTQVTWANNRGGSGTATGTTSWTASSVALQPGANILTITARDAAANSGATILTVTFTDTTPPTTAVTAPAAGATVTGTLNVTGTAADNVGVVGVQFRLDGANLGAEATSAPYAVSWNTTNTANGSHTLTAVARDAAGNSTTSAGVVVTVSNVAPPVISGVAVSGITSSAATISWTTDTLSDTQVEFGPTAAYGSASVLVATRVTSHTQTLSGLAPNATYHFRVKSRDAGGQLTTSGDSFFTTLPDINTSLIAYWTFNEGSGTTAADSSGNGNTGTLNGATWSAGIINFAVALDGVSNFVSAAHASALNAYPLTVSGWVRTSATTGTRGIVNKYVPGSSNGYRVFMSDGSLCAEYLRDGTSFVSDGTSCPLAASGYADGQWHLVTFTVDATGGRLYVDGVQRTSLGWTGTSGGPTTTQQITIGDDGGSGGFFAGTVDDLKIYTRALSAAEVSAVYAAAGGSGGSGTPVVTAVAVPSIGTSVATVTWTTNIGADTQVEFGATAAYGSITTLDAARVTSHASTLLQLAAGTVYHFRVRSRDAAGNLAVSADSSFRTPDMPRVQRKHKGNFFDDILKWILG
jgi:hypothetical protein